MSSSSEVKHGGASGIRRAPGSSLRGGKVFLYVFMYMNIVNMNRGLRLVSFCVRR